jgi:hypothetical protein
MLIRVNKNTGSHRQPVKYAALSTGTISHVWYDEESASVTSPKRRNRIKLIYTQHGATPNAAPKYDA